jgi:hypothetical protein
MRTPFTPRRTLYLLIAICCTSAICFYPFLSSSISWMRNSHFRYENLVSVSLPFRWVSGEGAGLALMKPAASMMSFTPDTTFAVHDFGPNLKPTDEQRTRLCHDLGICVSQGNMNDPTYPFTSAGLICSRVTKPSVILWVRCLSCDFRYSFDFMGNKEYIAEAAEIAKQIVR